MEEHLIKILKAKDVDDFIINRIINNGYIVRRWNDFKTPEGYLSISDKMYGNKQFSSSFDIDEFIRYAKGEIQIPRLPDFVTYKAKNKRDILNILNDKRRQRYIQNGQMSFRGQVKEYKFKRDLPNPRRANSDGEEISIIPGRLRGKPLGKTFHPLKYESYSFQYFLKELEPNNPNVFWDSSFAFDMMRVEQHYSNQTNGLDISFDIDTAIFFATTKFNWDSDGFAYHTKVENDNHQGVIYCFVFRDPPVKKTEFLINGFDLFKTYKPERILRQKCGLPLFSEFDRNIAICDIDCIIYLDQNFTLKSDEIISSEYMFPNKEEDKFYGKLIDIKKKYKMKELENIVEYRYEKASS